MELKVSESSYSSSFFHVHENHINAAAETRQIQTLSVLVNRTDNLMSNEILAQIGAVKIDTQGFELEILKGLGNAFPSLAVLQVELSEVPCYVGAPLLAEVDRFIVEELGFRQIAISPSFRDDKTGIIQQYDAVYCREPSKPVPVRRQVQVDGVFSSIGRVLRRPDDQGKDWGQNWLQSCIASWHGFGAPVYSVSEIQNEIPNVTRVPTVAKPSIREVFQKIGEMCSGHSIVTNSDILLTPALKQRVAELEPDTLYIGNRLGVSINPRNPSDLKVENYYRFGFDFFIVPPSLVKRINSEDILPKFLRFGEPWWDYALPLVAMDIGIPVKNFRLDPPAALHLQHANSSNKWFEEQGMMLLEWYAKSEDEASKQLVILKRNARIICTNATYSRREKVLAFYDNVTQLLVC